MFWPKLGVSSGTLRVLGLAVGRDPSPPTTAYLFLGGRCQGRCAYCPQAQGSQGLRERLGRIRWPERAWEEVLPRLQAARETGAIRRVCLQTVLAPGVTSQIPPLVAALGGAVSVSAGLRRLDEVEQILAAGAERLGLALDGATAAVAHAAGRPWRHRLLLEAARRFPGRISTHLVVGLGETEAEMVARFRELLDHGVRIGLFAFTPVAGTVWADRPAPSLRSYRRLQLALFLLERGQGHLDFDGAGQLTDFGLETEELLLPWDEGEAWRTRGCPDCNRPYYNESPRLTPYNFSRPLAPAEARAELERALL